MSGDQSVDLTGYLVKVTTRDKVHVVHATATGSSFRVHDGRVFACDAHYGAHLRTLLGAITEAERMCPRCLKVPRSDWARSDA